MSWNSNANLFNWRETDLFEEQVDRTWFQAKNLNLWQLFLGTHKLRIPFLRFNVFETLYYYNWIVELVVNIYTLDQKASCEPKFWNVHCLYWVHCLYIAVSRCDLGYATAQLCWQTWVFLHYVPMNWKYLYIIKIKKSHIYLSVDISTGTYKSSDIIV